MTGRKLVSAASPIRGNNQLMVTVGEEEIREGLDFGVGWDNKKGLRW